MESYEKFQDIAEQMTPEDELSEVPEENMSQSNKNIYYIHKFTKAILRK